MGRAPCCDKANVKKGPWSPEEDALLKAYIEENGTGGNWIALPHKIGLKRCGKSCRLRWLNYLRPNIRHGGFSEEEDQLICSLYISIGSRWSIIAAQLPGRTDNDIKNYWNTRLKKKLLGRRRDPSTNCRRLSPSPLDPSPDSAGSTNPSSPLQALSATALERMQLHLQLQGLHSPFSFYNNPALWPKLHPLAATSLLQAQPADAVGANTLHQGMEPTAMESWLPAKNDASINPNMEGVENSNLWFSSGSSSTSLEAVADHGLQAELHELLYGKSGCSVGEDSGNRLGELDCFQEMNGVKEGMDWWASTSGFDVKSSSWESASGLQPDSMIQQYVLGYDL